MKKTQQQNETLNEINKWPALYASQEVDSS